MEKRALLLIGVASMTLTMSAAQKQQPIAPIQEVSFTQVHLNDGFWSPRIEINRTVSIPSAFHECEVNGRFDNFALAAGLIKGEHKGDFSFDDTDPYKVIEGASYSLAVHYDAKLDHYLDSVINIIALAQESDGYLTTCVTNKCTRLSGWWGTRKWEKINSHELYNSGHLIESAVAHYRATGKKNFLNVAIKNADLVCKTFGPNEGQIHRPGGHPIIEMALCKLYKVTGNKTYLNGAKYFVEETGRCTDGHKPSEYSQDHMPILQQEEIVGHAVRAGYLYSGVADVAALTGDKAYFEALERIWENMSSKKLFITGGIGSRPQGEGFGPNYELNNHTAYCETCAAIANVYWNYRMFLATGESKYMDVCERALYNNVMSGVSLSGDKFFYDNPLESDGEHERQKWFGCACCPGNITRFVASIPGYIYAQQGKDIYVNLYAQGKAQIGNIELEQTTNYPYDSADVKCTIMILAGTSGDFETEIVIFSVNRFSDWCVHQASIDCYLHLVTDAFSRMIIGYVLSPTLEAKYTIEALEQAINHAGSGNLCGTIHHSDRGVQYCCDEYVTRLKDHHIRISMTEDSDPTDNGMAERVNGIIKNEFLDPRPTPKNLPEAWQLVSQAVHTYNTLRPHLSLEMRTPAQVYVENK